MKPNQWLIGLLISLVTVIVTALFFYVLSNQFRIYEQIWTADEIKKSPIASLAIARAYEFSSVKFISIFLSFIMIISGSLYILNAGNTVFSASGEIKDKGSAAISATSPGIIVVLFGTILAGLSISNKTELNALYNLPPAQVGVANETITPIPR